MSPFGTGISGALVALKKDPPDSTIVNDAELASYVRVVVAALQEQDCGPERTSDPEQCPHQRRSGSYYSGGAGTSATCYRKDHEGQKPAAPAASVRLASYSKDVGPHHHAALRGAGL